MIQLYLSYTHLEQVGFYSTPTLLKCEAELKNQCTLYYLVHHPEALCPGAQQIYYIYQSLEPEMKNSFSIRSSFVGKLTMTSATGNHYALLLTAIMVSIASKSDIGLFFQISAPIRVLCGQTLYIHSSTYPY